MFKYKLPLACAILLTTFGIIFLSQSCSKKNSSSSTVVSGTISSSKF